MLNRLSTSVLVALMGVSAAVLFLVFAWLSAPFRAAPVGVFVIGHDGGHGDSAGDGCSFQRKAEFREIVSRVLTLTIWARWRCR